MTRHSKNQNERPFFSHAERSKVGFGHLRETIESESQSQFGYCCLSLRPCDDPVATPDGFIYDRDVLIEFMATEKARLSALASDGPKLPSTSNRISKPASNSFWMNAPTAPVAPSSSKIDTHPRCPMSGNKLRLKDLIPVKLESSKTPEGKEIYVCSVSKRPISHHKAVLLKPSGLVLLESVYNEVVKPLGKCPVTGMTLKHPDDILPLKTSANDTTQIKRDVGIKSRAFEGSTRGLKLH